jgi:porin
VALIVLLMVCCQPPESAAQTAAGGDNNPPTLDGLLNLPNWMQLQVGIRGEPLFNPEGGLMSAGAWVQQGSVDLDMSPGLSKPLKQWRELDHWGLNINVVNTTGYANYSYDIGALFPLQEVAYPPGFWLSEATIERRAGAGLLSVKAGILSLDPDFLAVPIAGVYVHSALNNTLNVTNFDLPINPYAAVGGVLTLKPSQVLRVRVGIYSLDTVMDVSSWLGVQPSPGSQGHGTMQIAQIDYSGMRLGPSDDQPIKACKQPRALVRQMPRCSLTTVQNQLPGGLITLGAFNSNDHQSGDGVYGSITARSGLPIGLDDRVWLGVSYSPNRDIDFAPTFVAGGVLVQGLVPGRPLDLVVFGLGRAGLSSEALPVSPTSPYEGMLELGYRVMVNQTLQLQPTLQWIMSPSGADQPVPGILAMGMRIDVNF